MSGLKTIQPSIDKYVPSVHRARAKFVPKWEGRVVPGPPGVAAYYRCRLARSDRHQPATGPSRAGARVADKPGTVRPGQPPYSTLDGVQFDPFSKQSTMKGRNRYGVIKKTGILHAYYCLTNRQDASLLPLS